MIFTVTHRVTSEDFRAWCRAQEYPECAQGTTVQFEEWVRLVIRESLDTMIAPPKPSFKVKVRRHP